MEVHLTPELEAKLQRKAIAEGRSTETLVQEAVKRLVDYDEWFIREVEEGLAAADGNDFLEHEKIQNLIKSGRAARRRI